MRDGLGKTLNRLRAAARQPVPAEISSRLIELNRFGSNPGRLKAFHFVPAPSRGAPLVVVLHGCTQNAAGYDRGSGWSALAEENGFALLFAEQQASNNPNLCFNWFRPEDVRRGSGEALSIRQMIRAMIDAYGLDQARIYITGLSAGGAMTSVMLATHPEIFAGGAIIAGLPYGEASSIPEALERMRGQGLLDDDAAAHRVRTASPHRGPWPSISVWHGTADMTVSPANADAIVGQWRSIHGVGTEPDHEKRVDGFPHRAWIDAQGRTAIEEYKVTGMGHGTPLDVSSSDNKGTAMPHMLDVGIDSSRHIAASWGLIGNRSAISKTAVKAPPRHADKPRIHATHATTRRSGVQATIEAALRSAGLMR